MLVLAVELAVLVVLVDMVLGLGWVCSYCESQPFLIYETQSGQLLTLSVTATSYLHGSRC